MNVVSGFRWLLLSCFCLVFALSARAPTTTPTPTPDPGQSPGDAQVQPDEAGPDEVASGNGVCGSSAFVLPIAIASVAWVAFRERRSRS